MKFAPFAFVLLLFVAVAIGCQPAQPPKDSGDSAGQVETIPANLEADAADLAKSFTETFANLAAKLSQATDTDAAKAAIPALEKAAEELDQLRAQAGKLPEHTKFAFRAVVNAGVKPVQKKIKEVREKEGIGPILQPALDAISEKLAKLVD